MKRSILIFALLIPLFVYAEVPGIKTLGKEAQKQENVEYQSVGSFMLGVASAFAEKQDRETFKMLNNIEMIECKNHAYAPKLVERATAIAKGVGATFLGSQDDGQAVNDIYMIMRGDIIKELIIIVKSHSGDVDVVVMSGEIPVNRLEEIASMKKYD